VIAIEGRECIGKTKATIMNHVKTEKIRQWMVEQEQTRGDEELMWGRANNVDWDMMMETGRTGTVRERRQRMCTMFNGLATNEWIKRQCDEHHDARCECGMKETQEHIICACTVKGVLKARKAMVMEVDDIIFGVEGEKEKCVGEHAEGTTGMDGTKERNSSEKMVGRWHISDVDGFHHERME
jgi:hypothetical protein